jgi:uncharacterized protein YidB (DUF937 family)
MGLLDILNSIQTAGAPSQPRPGSTPSVPAGQSQGMSPMAKAMLALLAFYAMKNMQRQGAPPTQPGQVPSRAPGGTITAGSPGGGSGGGSLNDLLGGLLGGGGRPAGSPTGGAGGGGLGDLLRGPLGGILGGAAAGTVVSGGLDELLKQLQQGGGAKAAQSWVGTGPNQMMSEGDLASALGGDTLDALTGQTGMDRSQLLAGLSQQLPGFIDQLTPHGRIPTDDEAARMV